MTRPHDDLFTLEHEILALKPPGQAQDQESKERQRNFIKRAEAIEVLKTLRLREAKQGSKSPRPAKTDLANADPAKARPAKARPVKARAAKARTAKARTAKVAPSAK